MWLGTGEYPMRHKLRVYTWRVLCARKRHGQLLFRWDCVWCADMHHLLFASANEHCHPTPPSPTVHGCTVQPECGCSIPSWCEVNATWSLSMPGIVALTSARFDGAAPKNCAAPTTEEPATCHEKPATSAVRKAPHGLQPDPQFPLKPETTQRPCSATGATDSHQAPRLKGDARWCR